MSVSMAARDLESFINKDDTEKNTVEMSYDEG